MEEGLPSLNRKKKKKSLISSYKAANILVLNSSLGLQLRIYACVYTMYMYDRTIEYYYKI